MPCFVHMVKHTGNIQMCYHLNSFHMTWGAAKSNTEWWVWRFVMATGVCDGYTTVLTEVERRFFYAPPLLQHNKSTLKTSRVSVNIFSIYCLNAPNISALKRSDIAGNTTAACQSHTYQLSLDYSGSYSVKGISDQRVHGQTHTHRHLGDNCELVLKNTWALLQSVPSKNQAANVHSNIHTNSNPPQKMKDIRSHV